MPKLTITVEDEVLRWARVKAAGRNTSLARLVGQLLKEGMQDERDYEAAKRRFLGPRPRIFSGGPYPARDGLHDR